MRLGSFLLGGIAGAAAVIYVNRKTKSMLFSAFSSSNNAVGKMMNKAQNPVTNQTSSSRSGAQSSQNQSRQGQNTGNENILPHQAANEILSKTDQKSAGMH